MMMGSADALPAQPTKTYIFEEDLSVEQKHKMTVKILFFFSLVGETLWNSLFQVISKLKNSYLTHT